MQLRFEDMLRAALVAYVADLSSADGGLTSHAVALRSVLANFPEPTPAPLAELGDVGCAGQTPTPFERLASGVPMGCVTFSLKQRGYMMVTRGSERLPNFPLIVVVAGKGFYTLPMRHLYRPEALERKDLPQSARGPT